MGTISVNQIIVTPLKRIKVLGGDVLHALKSNDEGFLGFGEAYFSLIDYLEIKAWKRHLNMTLNLVVPIGSVKFVFIDDQGSFREEVAGEENYKRITVPPKIWFGFCGLAEPRSLLMNISDIIHDQEEVERMNLDSINYKWDKIS